MSVSQAPDAPTVGFGCMLSDETPASIKTVET